MTRHILHVHVLCVYVCVALQYTVYVLFFLSIPDVHSHTVIPHNCMQVLLCLCMLIHVFSVHVHILYVHMPLCHREKGGVSIFPSPFFGDNDGHFFFSVTDDRQN